VKRRDFIAGLGATAAWPLASQAQQQSLPIVAYLSASRALPPALLNGLTESGYAIGRNVRIERRTTEDARQLPALVADLVRLQPSVISAQASAVALAVKAATSTIPIVFGIGDDPVRLGLVASLNRPGGNLTGATNLNVELEGKRLAMMHAIVPAGETIAALVDANNPAADRQLANIQNAADSLGRKIRILKAANERDIDNAFKTIAQEKLGSLFVAADAYFGARSSQFVTLAAYNAVPVFYSRREFAEAGGLVSYGTDNDASFRQQGIYIGRILNGERPADLPVVQATKFELVINLKTAKSLGVTFPIDILALADTVIE